MKSCFLSFLIVALTLGFPVKAMEQRDTLQQCSEIGCQNGLTFDFGTELRGAGTYEFILTADGQTSSCSGLLPLPDCETQALTCSPAGQMMIMESGCALEPAAHGFGPTITLVNAPRNVTLTIRRNGQPIAHIQDNPAYQRVQPNGPNCHPICDMATIPVKITSKK